MQKRETKIKPVPTSTNTKKTDKTLNTQNSLLKDILNNSQDIIILYNLSKKKSLLISKNISSILNYKIKDIRNLTDEDIHNLIHSEDYKKYKEIFSGLYKLNNGVSEFRLKIKNTKNYKWFREKFSVIQKDKFNKPEIILYNFTDISSHKDLEKKLAEAEEKLKDFENLHQYAHWELDIKTNKINGNDKFYEMFDLEPNKKINKDKLFKLIHPEDLKTFKSAFSSVLKGQIEQNTSRIKLKSGETKYISSSLKPVLNKNKVSKISGISFDISESKLAEKKLKEYTRELKELNRSKDKYFSIIAHDLRGPFTGLLGFSNLLKEEYDYLTRAEVKHYISLINSSSKNIYGLIENLLQWSRLQTGRLLFQPANINLNSIVDEVIMIYKTQAVAKYIDIVKDIPNDIYVYADENMLKSILQNLVSNSIKFSEEGGKIILSAEENENKYTISVSDTGIGIHPEVIEKLFKIDFHYTTPGTRDEKGSGLGLILCKEFVEKHGSKIKVKSEQKIGTTVSFDLKKGKPIKK